MKWLEARKLRSKFNRLMEERKTLDKQHAHIQAEIIKEFNAEVEAAYFAAFPKKRKAPGFDKQADALGEAFRPILDRWKDIAKRSLDALMETRRELDDAIDAAAEGAPLSWGPEWRLLRTARRYNYSTQTQSAKYARCEAELMRVRLLKSGLQEVEVRENTDGDYEVWAKVEGDMDVALADRKGMTIRDFVRYAWGLGVNPRVYNPFIPPGFEEENELDYFGRDLREEREMKARAA